MHDISLNTFDLIDITFTRFLADFKHILRQPPHLHRKSQGEYWQGDHRGCREIREL